MGVVRHGQPILDAVSALWAQTEPRVSALEIGRRVGLTKNSVVSLVHRLKLAKRPSPIRMRAEGGEMPKPSRLDPTKPKAATLEPLPSVATIKPLRMKAPGGGGVRACVFPLWPNGQRPGPNPRYCDAGVALGEVYCPVHRALCYHKPQPMSVPT